MRYILITGAAGFIGSCLAGNLNRKGQNDLILVDEFSQLDKIPNLEGKHYAIKVERDELFSWLEKEQPVIDLVYHLGARTDTTEFDYVILERLNLEYSKNIWTYCSRHAIPLVYASSAATYGDGGKGYEDDHRLVNALEPLNPYGISKNEFDKWALQQQDTPPHWYGLKFFNVYGPNEYHKGRMASVIFHAFNQIKEKGSVNLFRSHHPDYQDGRQLRDFIYVKDVIAVCQWLAEHLPTSGIFNLGTGKARSFEDLVLATFSALDMEPDIRFVDMPEDIRSRYQYFTEAEMDKLKTAGYDAPFHSLEEGIADYVRNYLAKGAYL
jgi:ADP-L-glycero-D-manno-heptose 6-epimerase